MPKRDPPLWWVGDKIANAVARCSEALASRSQNKKMFYDKMYFNKTNIKN
jgi:hypothetical protein